MPVWKLVAREKVSSPTGDKSLKKGAEFLVITSSTSGAPSNAILGPYVGSQNWRRETARKLNMGFCYAHIRRPKRGYYEVEIKEMHPQTDPDVDEYAYTDEFVRMFEQNVKESPELWMQWGGYRF